MTVLRHISHLFLIASFVLTGLGLAAAKGQGAGPSVAQIELCVGLHVITIRLDEDGNPVTGRALCPDAGNAFLTDAGIAPVIAAPFRTIKQIAFAQSTASMQASLPPEAQARGPPERV